MSCGQVACVHRIWCRSLPTSAAPLTLLPLSQVKAFVELAASLLSTTGRPGRSSSQAAQQTAVSAEIVRAMKDAGGWVCAAVVKHSSMNRADSGHEGCGCAAKDVMACI